MVTSVNQQQVTGVVMVEDDPDVCTLMNLVSGGQCVFYRDGASAIAAFESGNPSMSLVILDLDLPKKHGFDVLRSLRANPKTALVPVVIFTATDADSAMGMSLGANAWVKKPNDADELAGAMEQILRFWLGLHVSTTPAP